MDIFVNCGLLLHISCTCTVYVVASMLQMLQMLQMVHESDMVVDSDNFVGCDRIYHKSCNFLSSHFHVPRQIYISSFLAFQLAHEKEADKQPLISHLQEQSNHQDGQQGRCSRNMLQPNQQFCSNPHKNLQKAFSRTYEIKVYE